MRVLLTRPRAESIFLAREIAARGHDPLIAPLTDIIPLSVILPDLKNFRTLIFTSANGVRAFEILSAARDLDVYAVGDATAQAARDAGFKNVLSGGGTVAALNERLAQEKITGPLHLSGTHVAGEITGAQRVALYEARAAASLPFEILAAFRAGGIGKVLFFSPRAAEIFVNLVKKHDIEGNIKVCAALCLSDSVVNSLLTLPWARLDVAHRPDRESLLGLLDRT